MKKLNESTVTAAGLMQNRRVLFVHGVLRPLIRTFTNVRWVNVDGWKSWSSNYQAFESINKKNTDQDAMKHNRQTNKQANKTHTKTATTEKT